MTETDLHMALMITDPQKAIFYKMAASDFGFEATDVDDEVFKDKKVGVRVVGPNSKRLAYWRSIDLLAEFAETLTTIARLNVAFPD